MVKITKTYTIAFAYAGIRQYADFHETADGKLHNPNIRVHYRNTLDLPDMLDITHIDQALEYIHKYVDKRASLQYINGQPVEYFFNHVVKNAVNDFHSRFYSFIESEATRFFTDIVVPMFKENDWFISTSHVGMPIPIEKNEEGEWDNIGNRDKEFMINYISAAFIGVVEKSAKIRIKNETGGDHADAFQYLIKHVPNAVVEQSGLLIKL